VQAAQPSTTTVLIRPSVDITLHYWGQPTALADLVGKAAMASGGRVGAFLHGFCKCFSNSHRQRSLMVDFYFDEGYRQSKKDAH
jgi:hypothetical protein